MTNDLRVGIIADAVSDDLMQCLTRWNNIIYTNSSQVVAEHLLAGREFATIIADDTSLSDFEVARQRGDPNMCRYHYAGNDGTTRLDTAWIGFLFVRNSTATGAFNYSVLTKQNKFNEVIVRSWEHFDAACVQPALRARDRKPLDLLEVSGSFVVMLGGIVTACAAVLFEMALRRALSAWQCYRMR